MRAITHTLLAEILTKQNAILELGCGTGTLLQEFAQRYQLDLLVGTDQHPLALAHAGKVAAIRNRAANSATVRFAQSDLHHLPFPNNCFHLVVALDVYDQQGIALWAALQESRRVLCAHGHLLLRVSAYPWLMSAHDTAFNTARRYSRQALMAALRGARFTPMRITYANTVLAPPVIVLRLLQRWSILPHNTALYTDSVSNHLLAAVLRCEAAWLRRKNLPGGISLYALARKEE